jgi:hypothetical protein
MLQQRTFGDHPYKIPKVHPMFLRNTMLDGLGKKEVLRRTVGKFKGPVQSIAKIVL